MECNPCKQKSENISISKDSISENKVDEACCNVWKALSVTLCATVAALSITIAIGTSVAAVAIIASIVASAALLALASTLSPTVRNICMTTIHYTVATIVELGVLLFSIFTFPVDLTRWDNVDPDEVTVVQIHGFMHRSPGFMLMQNRLKRAGIKSIISINLGWPTLKSIDEYTEDVGELLKKYGIKKAFLVGHSMGGLIATNYATTLAKTQKVDVVGVATLGSPLNGTCLAYMGCGKCAQEMRQGSPFITKLTKAMITTKIPFLHVSSESDLIVRPIESASETPIENVRHYSTPWFGHVGVLFSCAVADEVADFYHEVSPKVNL